MQKRILIAMAETDFAAFTGEKSRVLGFGIFEGKYGGIIIRAYQSPYFFLKNRGLIEPCPRNVLGYWYRITDAGRSAIKAGA